MRWQALGAAFLAAIAAPIPAAAQAPAPLVIVAEYDGVIQPVAAEFFGDVIASATQRQAAVIVLELRTPGGLLESTSAMVARMIGSPVPVVVFVAPSGSRAASAGFILTIAADVAAMAPGTHIGAAHPVGASGEDAGAAGEKAAADTAAYVRTLAAARGRNVPLAEAAVLQSRAFTETEARDADPPLIDLIAADLPALLAQLDGRDVRRFDGKTSTLHTAGATIERMSMTRRQRLLSAIAHPQIAYLLFSLGMLGLVVELWNPGSVAPGVVGGICLVLAFFAFQVIAVDVAGLLLLILGVGLLIAEAFVPSFGILGIGGIAAFIAGSIMVTNDVPGVRVGYGAIVPVAVALAAIVLGLGRLAMRAQRMAPATGVAAMVGEAAAAVTALSPDAPGQVTWRGEIWRAVSTSAVPAGTRVRIRSIDGLTLTVEPVTPPQPKEADRAV